MNYLILYNTNKGKYGYISKKRYLKLKSNASFCNHFEVVGFKHITNVDDFRMFKRVVKRLSETLSYFNTSEDMMKLSFSH